MKWFGFGETSFISWIFKKILPELFNLIAVTF